MNQNATYQNTMQNYKWFLTVREEIHVTERFDLALCSLVPRQYCSILDSVLRSVVNLYSAISFDERA